MKEIVKGRTLASIQAALKGQTLRLTDGTLFRVDKINATSDFSEHVPQFDDINFDMSNVSPDAKKWTLYQRQRIYSGPKMAKAVCV